MPISRKRKKNGKKVKVKKRIINNNNVSKEFENREYREYKEDQMKTEYLYEKKKVDNPNIKYVRINWYLYEEDNIKEDIIDAIIEGNEKPVDLVYNTKEKSFYWYYNNEPYDNDYIKIWSNDSYNKITAEEAIAKTLNVFCNNLKEAYGNYIKMPDDNYENWSLEQKIKYVVEHLPENTLQEEIYDYARDIFDDEILYDLGNQIKNPPQFIEEMN